MAAAVESLGRDSSTLSPLFHYFVTRFEMGGADATGNLDLGVSLYEASTRGICALKAHDVPFDEAGIAIRPSAQAYADAKTRALGGNPFDLPYVRADGVSRSTWIREQIRLDRPVLIGFRMPEPYPDSFLDRTFQWADPNAFLSLATGHCVLATGFSDARLAVHVLDSRGGQMFDGGRWWMGYRVIDSGIVSEIYAIRR